MIDSLKENNDPNIMLQDFVVQLLSIEQENHYIESPQEWYKNRNKLKNAVDKAYIKIIKGSLS